MPRAAADYILAKVSPEELARVITLGRMFSVKDARELISSGDEPGEIGDRLLIATEFLRSLAKDQAKAEAELRSLFAGSFEQPPEGEGGTVMDTS